MSCRVVSCRVVSCRVLSCPVLSCPVLSCPVLFCSVLFCSVAFFFVLIWSVLLAGTVKIILLSQELSQIAIIKVKYWLYQWKWKKVKIMFRGMGPRALPLNGESEVGEKFKNLTKRLNGKRRLPNRAVSIWESPSRNPKPVKCQGGTTWKCYRRSATGGLCGVDGSRMWGKCSEGQNDAWLYTGTVWTRMDFRKDIVNTRLWPIIGLILVQRRRRWTNNQYWVTASCLLGAHWLISTVWLSEWSLKCYNTAVQSVKAVSSYITSKYWKGKVSIRLLYK